MRCRLHILYRAMVLAMLFVPAHPCYPAPPAGMKGVFLPPQSFHTRKIEAFLHYAALAGMNGAVLHVKDPRGRIYWASAHPTAGEIKAYQGQPSVKTALSRLKKKGIWSVAKMDVFADTRFARHFPDKGIRDRKTFGLWTDKTGGHWTNPHDRSVWDYNIGLARELGSMGFDEIQFDYLRFPSDGDLGRIRYPFIPEGETKAMAMGRFLQKAAGILKPLGVLISVDVFGLTAWKHEDFGVGQVVETMAPHVDIICPMFYPSHFPRGFLGMDRPEAYPEAIMALSLARMKQRVHIRIRPWIQGFWYTSHEIRAQLDAVRKSGIQAWTIWNVAGNYANTYLAIADQMKTVFTRPQFYPTLARLRQGENRIVKGNRGIIHFTDFRRGYSILTLEPFAPLGDRTLSTPSGLIATLDEAVMDRILARRGMGFTTGRYKKILALAEFMAKDLKTHPRRMRPGPIHIDWDGDCRFRRPDEKEIER